MTKCTNCERLLQRNARLKEAIDAKRKQVGKLHAETKAHVNDFRKAVNDLINNNKFLVAENKILKMRLIQATNIKALNEIVFEMDDENDFYEVTDIEWERFCKKFKINPETKGEV